MVSGDAINWLVIICPCDFGKQHLQMRFTPNIQYEHPRSSWGWYAKQRHIFFDKTFHWKGVWLALEFNAHMLWLSSDSFTASIKKWCIMFARVDLQNFMTCRFDFRGSGQSKGDTFVCYGYETRMTIIAYSPQAGEHGLVGGNAMTWFLSFNMCWVWIRTASHPQKRLSW